MPLNRTAAFIGVALLIAVAPVWGQTSRAKSEPLAEVNGTAITEEDVAKIAGVQIAKLEEQIYQLKLQVIEALVREKLVAAEASKRAISVQALLDAEVTAKVKLVTEREIEQFYQENKGQFRGDEAAIKERIRAQLQNQKLAAQRDVFVQSLRSRAEIAVHLKAPPVFRAQVRTDDGSPAKGADAAPVTIVEFSDFHCPFCKRADETLKQILTRYGDKVKLVFRDFPIDQLHPKSRAAHEAARCAGEQGKFWDYHSVLFAGNPKNADQLTAVAEQVGLDVAKFDQCVESGKYRVAVQKDIDEGDRLGVTGTPAFFINGRMLSGAQPLENFVRLIDDELSRAPQSQAAR